MKDDYKGWGSTFHKHPKEIDAGFHVKGHSQWNQVDNQTEFDASLVWRVMNVALNVAI